MDSTAARQHPTELDQRLDRTIEALRQGVVPATGCTEPIALAYAAARAAAVLGEEPERIDAQVSPNVMKNAMAVMVPGTGTAGLEMAAAIGAIDGDPDAGLDVLATVTPEGVSHAAALIARGAVRVQVADVPDELYAEATVHHGPHRARVCIAKTHTNVFRIEHDGETLVERPRPESSTVSSSDQFLQSLTLREIHDMVVSVPLERITFMLEAERLNLALAEAGRTGDYGLNLGSTIMNASRAGLSGSGLDTTMVAMTSAASDARMGGAPLPAMTNAGSGNQGITATIPVSVAADHVGADAASRIRALTLSHLTALYVHAGLPVLSAFCAAASAAMGAAAGIAFLFGGGYPAIERAVSSMAGDTVGMVCDGAGCSCTLKVASSVGSAMRAVLLAMNETRVPGTNGLVFDDVDATIRSVGRLATRGMANTDPEILSIMLSKAPIHEAP